MILDIIQYPNDILHTVCDPVEKVDSEIGILIQNMKETMVYSKGIGLAAIQVGVAKRIFVMELIDEAASRDDEKQQVLPGATKVFINPVIISSSGSMEYEEGCLSVKGIYAKLNRAAHIEVQYQDEAGARAVSQFSGLAAVCVQHEIDHLNGIVFVEKLSRLKQDMILKKIKKLQYAM